MRPRTIVIAAAYSERIGLEGAERALGSQRYALPQGSVDFTYGTFGRDDGSHCERLPGS